MHLRLRMLFAQALLIIVLICALTASHAVDETPQETPITSEAHFDVPFYYQEKDYYCGPAVLQMVFSYYGENVSQSEIACVARSIGEPVYVTFADELRRAGHFSNMSTSMGGELPENITGYSLRSLGYAAFETQGMNLTAFEETLSENGPLILLMWYSNAHVSTHFRVATGYNETHVFLHDPWNNVTWSGRYGGPNIPFNNTEFMDLWSYYGNWALLVTPWKVNLSFPAYIKPGKQFQINATITYPEMPPGTLLDYPASSCNASISLPANLSFTEGESQKKTIETGSLQSGTNSTVSWTLVANSSVMGMVNLTAEGMISGSVWPEYNFTGYDYNDSIGISTSLIVQLDKDQIAPEIGIPIRKPNTDVQPYQDVEISVKITDTESGVQNSTLQYTADNGTTWENVTMNLNQATSFYEATIPGQQAGTWIRFEISSTDYLDNKATLDGTEPYCIYQVVPELSSFPILLLIIATMTAVMIFKRKPNNQTTDLNSSLSGSIEKTETIAHA